MIHLAQVGNFQLAAPPRSKVADDIEGGTAGGDAAGQRRKLELDSEEERREKAKESVRAKVEHSFLRIKRLFRYPGRTSEDL